AGAGGGRHRLGGAGRRAAEPCRRRRLRLHFRLGGERAAAAERETYRNAGVNGAAGPHGEERRAATRLEPWGPNAVRRFDSLTRRSKLPAISASFLARDQPFILRSAAMASTIRSKYSLYT